MKRDKHSLASKIVFNNMVGVLGVSLLCLIILTVIHSQLFIRTAHNDCKNSLSEYSQELKKKIENDVFKIDSLLESDWFIRIMRY